MKITLTKDIELNGIKKKEGTILDVTVGFAQELIKKKKARETGNIETPDEKEFKKTRKKKTEEVNNVDENNEINE